MRSAVPFSSWRGMCDTHVHVIGPHAQFALDSARRYTPSEAPRALLEGHLQTVGANRVVIVQPSFYGTDNRCTLHAVAQLNAGGAGSAVQARAVAVVAADITDAELAQLHGAGVRGLRLNVHSGGHGVAAQNTPRHISELAARIAPFGWHVQVFAAAEQLAELAPTFARLPVPVVLDHFGLLHASELNGAVGRAQVDLVGSGRAYVKLSAPHRASVLGGDYPDLAAVAQAFARANPERLLWGSDWPHTHADLTKSASEISPCRSMDAAHHLALLRGWVDDDRVMRQTLIDNPAQLYGF